MYIFIYQYSRVRAVCTDRTLCVVCTVGTVCTVSTVRYVQIVWYVQYVQYGQYEHYVQYVPYVQYVRYILILWFWWIPPTRRADLFTKPLSLSIYIYSISYIQYGSENYIRHSLPPHPIPCWGRPQRGRGGSMGWGGWTSLVSIFPLGIEYPATDRVLAINSKVV